MRAESRRGPTRGLLTLLALVGLLRCSSAGGPEAEARHTALEVFALARSGEAKPEELTRLFDERATNQNPGTLLEALEALGRTGAEVRVLRVERLEDLQRVAVDLSVELPGNGAALYSLQLTRGPAGWVVLWLQGPGVTWPPRASSRGPGLSTSATPQG